MKRIILGISAAALLFACGEGKTDETNPTNVDADSTAVADTIAEVKTEFGQVTVNPAEAITTADLLKQFNGKEELEATFTGEITEVCAKMGCWVTVKNPTEGEEDFMVRFKDHFTIPTDTELGSTAYLHGTAIQDTVSVDFQRHLLEDGGMSKEEAEKAVSEEKITMTFIADGIKLAEK